MRQIEWMKKQNVKNKWSDVEKGLKRLKLFFWEKQDDPIVVNAVELKIWHEDKYWTSYTIEGPIDLKDLEKEIPKLLKGCRRQFKKTRWLVDTEELVGK